MPDPVEILSELVRIPSVNPMGREDASPHFFEHSLSEHLLACFAKFGLKTEQHLVAPQRTNVLARIDGSTPPEEGGPLILLEAHQDTVPIEGMTIDPFEPTIQEGKLYGRGSCDVKGGMASMLAAIVRLSELRPERLPTVVLACTVDEEHGATGARHLAETIVAGRSELIPRLPDAAIVAEPTDLDIVVAHKGVVRWRCHTAGTACHSSQPERGNSAIYNMAKVLGALEQYAQTIAPSLGDHPLLGTPTLSVGTIKGGVSVNTVPDACTIEIDRRVLPDEDPQQVIRHAVEHVSSVHDIQPPPTHDEPIICTGGLSDSLNGDLSDRLSHSIRQFVDRGRKVGVAYGTNAQWYAQAGIPTVVFGPGSIEQAHTKDEWIPLDELRQATEILVHFLQQPHDHRA